MRKGMSYSEAGKLGAIVANVKKQLHKQEREDSYLKNPTTCKHCGTSMSYQDRHKIFCNLSCSANHDNKGRRKRTKEPSNCLVCGKQNNGYVSKYCSNSCHKEDQYNKWINLWLQGLETGSTSNGLSVSKRIRQFLIKKFGNKCSICGTESWQGLPVPLVLDHISGDSQDSSSQNVRLVCGNCNMQLPTFTGKNRGKGRLARKKWDNKLAKAYATQA